jgi:allantoin racemase
MHIHLVMPVVSDVMNEQILEQCKLVSSEDTKLTIRSITEGTESIECMFDEELAAAAILKEAKQAESEGADGVIIYCFGNPSVEAAKELLQIPVIGIGEAAQTIALPLCERYGIVTTIQNSVARNKRKARVLGTDSKLGSVLPLGLKVTELTGDRETILRTVTNVLQPQIEQRELDLLILGCGYLIGYTQELSTKLGVPVIDPGQSAIKLMETYISLGLAQSKKSYMTPPDKKRTCW